MAPQEVPLQPQNPPARFAYAGIVCRMAIRQPRIERDSIAGANVQKIIARFSQTVKQ